MGGWECVGLLVLAAVIYTIVTWLIIDSDNKPRKRWPGDP